MNGREDGPSLILLVYKRTIAYVLEGSIKRRRNIPRLDGNFDGLWGVILTSFVDKGFGELHGLSDGSSRMSRPSAARLPNQFPISFLTAVTER